MVKVDLYLPITQTFCIPELKFCKENFFSEITDISFVFQGAPQWSSCSMRLVNEDQAYSWIMNWLQAP